MAEFLTTAGCAHHIEQLVAGACERLTLVSPYLQVSPILLERLQEAARRGVDIGVVFGKDDLRAEQRAQLRRIGPRLRLLFLENVHAKCYASEAGMVLTSMNLYHYSEKPNREMGVLLAATEAAYAAACQEIDSITPAARAAARAGGEPGVLHPVPPADLPQCGEEVLHRLLHDVGRVRQRRVRGALLPRLRH